MGRLRAIGPFGLALRIALVAAAIVGMVFGALFAIDTAGRPISTLMLAHWAEGGSARRRYVRLDAVAPVLVASVIASEDAKFCQNDGVDWTSLHEVIEDADADGPSRGASTITMQTAKNLFLWPGRSKIRKGIELVVALVLGKVWSKPHTIEVYLNVAQWGEDLFGVEAAAQRYFHKPASRLDAREAALLATSLPNPIKRDPAHPRPFQRRLAASLAERARRSTEWLDCLPKALRYGAR